MRQGLGQGDPTELEVVGVGELHRLHPLDRGHGIDGGRVDEEAVLLRVAAAGDDPLGVGQEQAEGQGFLLRDGQGGR